jgi:TonB-linked SusC/RagA family outer membrane protein
MITVKRLLNPLQKWCLLILLLLFNSAILFSQENVNIRGVILSSTKEPIPGVSVSTNNRTGGTISDSAGKFSVSVPAGTTLIFSVVGYQSKEINVSKSNLNWTIELTAAGQTLDDVVVVSYGTQKRRNITGAVSTVNATELKDIPVINAGQQLQGKMAGVQINQNSGQPGANMSIRVRGAASINAGNNPLVVIDGFPSTNGFESISPGDIESISVLKDAAAASLYGSRAANGVILVTTKQARNGQQSITFNAYAGLQSVSKRGRPDLMNAREFAQFKKEYYEDAALYEGYTGGVPEMYQNPEQYGPDSGTDWFEVLLRDAPTQNYNLQLASGTNKLKSVVSFDFNRQDGVMINQWAQRFTGRANLKYDLSKYIEIGMNMGLTYRDQNITPGLGEGRNIIQIAYLMDPTIEYKNPDGTYPIGWARPGMFNSPNWYQVLRQRVNRNKNLTTISNAYAAVKILPGLEYKLSANINIDNGVSRNFSPSIVNGGALPGPSASASYNTGTNLSWMLENTLTYTKTLADRHNFELLGGYTAQKFNLEGSSINGSQFPDDNIEWLNVAATRVGNVSASNSSLTSLIGRVNYNFDNKYQLTAAFRRDGSSRFGANRKQGNFPSLSAGWIVSDENFLKNNRHINFLKIRAGWGKVGNYNIGDYSHLASVVQSNYVFNNQLVPGRRTNGIANAQLTWETTEGFNIGFELGILNNRINLTYDYYKKKTDGLLYAIDIPIQSGFNSVTSNIGRFDFWGHEISVQSRNLTGRLTWTTQFNITFDRNMVKKLGTSNAPIGGYQEYWDDNRTAVGHPIGMFYGYVNTGVYMTQEEFESQPKGATSMVGTARFADISGPDGKPDGKIDINDRKFIGNPNPDFIYGMTNQLSYGQFDFSFVLAGTVGNDIADDAFQSTENIDGVFNVRKGVANRWRSEENPGAGAYPRTRSGTTADFRNFSTRQVFSGSYLMGKNISLGYTLKLKNSSVIKSARVYATAQNFFTLTSYPGMNPEVSFAGLNGLNQGRDFTAFPIAKVYALGLNIHF